MSTNRVGVRANDQLEHALLAAWSAEANVGMCAIDENLNIVVMNAAACRMLAVGALEMLNEPFLKLVAAVDFLPDVVAWLATPGFDGERQASYERQGITQDLLFKATIVQVPDLASNLVPNLSASPSPSVSPSAALAQFTVLTITDITALMAAQRQVNSETFRRQWQALNAGVVIADARAPDMPIVYVNPMFEQITGYAASEVLGRNCRFLQGDDTTQPGLQVIKDAIKNQVSACARLRNFRKDGQMFINELAISPVKDETGAVIHFVGIQHMTMAKDLAKDPTTSAGHGGVAKL